MGVDKTSSGAGATPPSDPQPATGNAPAGATPQGPAVTLEEALAQLAELKHVHNNATGELKRHREKLTAYEEAEKKVQEASLSELEKANKRIADAEARSKQYQQQYISAQVQLAAQAKGVIDPEMAALAVEKTLEYDENGLPSNLDKALDELVKNKPYLVAAKSDASPPASPAQTATGQTTPTIPAMNPGRSSIPSPAGSPPPGRPRIPSWGEVYNNKR